MKREIGSQLALPPDNYPILLEELSHEWNSHFLRKRPIYSKLAELQWEQKVRSWIKIAEMAICEGDAMTWRVEMHSKFYVRTLHLPLEKRSLITHLLREMWKHHLRVSDLCSLATLPESVKWKAITGSAQFCQRDPNARFTPSRVKSVNSEEVVRFPNLDLPSTQGKMFFSHFYFVPISYFSVKLS